VDIGKIKKTIHVNVNYQKKNMKFNIIILYWKVRKYNSHENMLYIRIKIYVDINYKKYISGYVFVN